MASAYFALIQLHVGCTIRVWFSDGVRTGKILSNDENSPVKVAFDNGEVKSFSEPDLHLRVEKALFDRPKLYMPACPTGKIEREEPKKLNVVVPKR